MTKNNDFDPLLINGNKYEIGHLKDLFLTTDIQFQNGDVRAITVHMRPTNHLFSRELTGEDRENLTLLDRSGYLLKSYVHHEGNYQQVKGGQPKLKEFRVFCEDKWNSSFLFPKFVSSIKEDPKKVTILANAGDDKTCLSGILEVIKEADMVYLVFFKLSKVNSKQVNMLINSAYSVIPTHDKAKKLLKPNRDSKPFIVALKNIMEGRQPLENQKQNNRSHKRRKKK